MKREKSGHNEMLRNEMQVLLLLQKSRRDVVHSLGCAAIVLELLSGAERFSIASSFRIKLLHHYTEKEARGVVRQLCSALHHLHTCGIVHGDIKTENVLHISPTSQRVMLVDYGSSRIVAHGLPNHINKATPLIGTFDYLAPECFEKALEWHVRGFSADMRALGCLVCLLLLSGTLPFRENSRHEQEKAILHAGVDFSDTVWS